MDIILKIQELVNDTFNNNAGLVHNTLSLLAEAGDQNNTAAVADKSYAYLGAGIAMLGCVGVGIGQGFAAAHACSGVARNPEAVTAIRTMLIIGTAITESAAIYSLLVAFLLIFVA